MGSVVQYGGQSLGLYAFQGLWYLLLGFAGETWLKPPHRPSYRTSASFQNSCDVTVFLSVKKSCRSQGTLVRHSAQC